MTNVMKRSTYTRIFTFAGNRTSRLFHVVQQSHIFQELLGLMKTPETTSIYVNRVCSCEPVDRNFPSICYASDYYALLSSTSLSQLHAHNGELLNRSPCT